MSPIGVRAGAFGHESRYVASTLTDTYQPDSARFALDNVAPAYDNLVTVVTTGTTKTFTFCIPLISGVVGAQMPKVSA